MNIANYSLKKITPCADYGKITVEGEFHIIDDKIFIQNLYRLIPNITDINSGQLLSGKKDDFEIYIYGNKKFIISKLNNENEVINFLNILIK